MNLLEVISELSSNIDRQFAQINERLDRLEDRMTNIEYLVTAIENRLTRLEEHLGILESRVTLGDLRFSAMVEVLEHNQVISADQATTILKTDIKTSSH